MRRLASACFVALLACLLSGAAIAAPVLEASAASLSARLARLQHLHARFEQSLIDGRGVLLQRANGEFWAERPDRFRWETEAPFPEVLVGDGTTLWLWDPDLEQVTVRPYDERLRATPARLLSGAAETLVDGFEVTLLEEDGGAAAYALEPLGAEGLFDRLEIAFEADLPVRLVIHDGLGQRTEVRLLDVETRVPAAADLFRFEIPPGADVIREPAMEQGDGADRGGDG
jgi:outer membrane lipoprotein carrier protein